MRRDELAQNAMNTVEPWLTAFLESNPDLNVLVKNTAKAALATMMLNPKMRKVMPLQVIYRDNSLTPVQKLARFGGFCASVFFASDECSEQDKKQFDQGAFQLYKMLHTYFSEMQAEQSAGEAG